MNMFVLARNEDGVIKYCEQDGEGTEIGNAYDFGSLENAKRTKIMRNISPYI